MSQDATTHAWPQSGFIVQSWVHDGQLRIVGRLENGKSFALVVDDPEQEFFLSARQQQTLKQILSRSPDWDQLGLENWQSFAGEALIRITVPWSKKAKLSQFLSSSGLLVQRNQGDEDQVHLANRHIGRTIRIDCTKNSKSTVGRRVDVVLTKPSITKSDKVPALRWLSIDIETKPDMQIVAVGLVWGMCGQKPVNGLAPARQGSVVFWRGVPLSAAHIRSFATEAGMLTALSAQIREIDPDVISGWNVLEFDLRVLYGRYQTCGLAFDWGRTEDQVSSVQLSSTRFLQAIIPGRQVLDAMRLARSSGGNFEDYRLGTVASQVLGKNKQVSSQGKQKLIELEQLQSSDPLAFCNYCLEDARLALDIVDKLGLASLTCIRSSLTGVNLERAWTSIQSFEHCYGLELRKRKIIEPSRFDRTIAQGAEGGTVLDASPGLFHKVLVLDFRSLYPSIMRTFSIDPLAYQRCKQTLQNHEQSISDQIVHAPNGACFDSTLAILPDMLSSYASARARALAQDDEVASHVYKILQNSFYGVLGAAGCRYGLSALAGAITSFGKHFLYFARDFCLQKGLRVLYGDTDSVFVQMPSQIELSELKEQGGLLIQQINHAISQHVRKLWKTESFLEIRCDQIFEKFLIPRLRIDSSGDRGRAKGYAGCSHPAQELIIKGMEAIRSDYTELAKDFQRQLLTKLFAGESAQAVSEFARYTLFQLGAGLVDDKLVYKKVLRRAADDYHHGHSPQVRAAKLLGWTTQRGRIAYLMTLAGPQELTMVSSKPDYKHYQEHQLRPIWESLVLSAGLSVEDPFEKQLNLDW